MWLEPRNLELRNLGFRYGKGRWIFRNLNACIEPGRITGLLGDSGSGKSTLAKVLARYEAPVEGEVLLGGADYGGRGYRPVQLIFQHPEKAVNPRLRMRDILNEGFPVDEELIDRLGIAREWLGRYPGELSGGELQRFCIARSLGPATRFIIADEITAMFDPITQAQLWDILASEARRRNIGILLITHEQPLASRLCNEQLAMSNGRQSRQ